MQAIFMLEIRFENILICATTLNYSHLPLTAHYPINTSISALLSQFPIVLLCIYSSLQETTGGTEWHKEK